MSRIRHSVEQYHSELLTREINYWPVEDSSYTTKSTPILHQCLAGHQWMATPTDILRGRGCPKCANKPTKRKTTDEYIEELRVNGSKLTLSPEALYINNSTGIAHVCDRGHKNVITPKSALRGMQCPSCASKGRYSEGYFTKYPDARTLRAYIYLVKLKVEGKELLKLGVTINLASRLQYYSRFQGLLLDSRELSLYRAFLLEQQILQCHNDYKETPTIKFDGYTETFPIDMYEFLREDMYS